MKNESMDIHGRALMDYYNGDKEAFYSIERSDGSILGPMSAKMFFREDGFDAIEKAALDRCCGKVLDIGAGAGAHSLFLKQKGLDVLPVDISPSAVEVMKKRGLPNARVGDLYDTYGELFDTVFIIMNIGITGDIKGLKRFLTFLPEIMKEDGQLLTDSFDIREKSEDAEFEKYKNTRVESGKYAGERTMRFHYKGTAGSWGEWMYIDPEELRKHVESTGLRFELLADNGRYLARITR